MAGVAKSAGARQGESPAERPAAGQARRLAPLRSELEVLPATPRHDGSPCWTIHDPSSHRFFRIGWQEHEMLLRWSLGEPAAIARAVGEATTLATSLDDVMAFSQFLVAANLLEVAGDGQLALLKLQARPMGPLQWLLAHYLFIRMPLFHPDRLLTRLLPYVEPLLTRTFLVVVGVVALVGGLLVARQWDAFIHSIPFLFTPIGVATLTLTVVTAKVVHELGHAFVSKHFGLRVPTMGVALVLMLPVLYTDTSDAWKLTDRRARMAIDAAGMAAEVTLAAFATLLWSLLPEGTLRSGVFILCTTSWVLTLAINLNPLMRFDGYYLLSDLIDLPNLQVRAFAMARWQLRALLFGLDEEPPETLSPHQRWIATAYAYATWVYRFFLYTGIAFLVYRFTFKVLGLFLLAVELGFFIVVPVWRELKVWAGLRTGFRLNRNVAVSGAAALALAALLFVPWNSASVAPAILRSALQTDLVTARAGRIDQLDLRDGEAVRQGAVLVRLASPEADRDLAQTSGRADLVRYQVQDTGVLPATSTTRVIPSDEDLAAAQAARSAAETEEAALVTRAPADGVVVDLDPTLATGEWAPAQTRVATLIDPHRALVEAYVAEADVGRFRVGASGRFLPDDPAAAAIPVTVVSIDRDAVRALRAPALSSLARGPIPVAAGEGGALAPQTAVYRVMLAPKGAAPPAWSQIRGKVLLDSAPRSLAETIWRQTVGVLIRESGF